MLKDNSLFLRSGSGADQQKNYLGQLLRYPHQKIGALGDVDASGIGRDAIRRLETEVRACGLPGERRREMRRGVTIVIRNHAPFWDTRFNEALGMRHDAGQIFAMVV